MNKLLLTVIFFIIPFRILQGESGETCPFCDDQILERQTFYEDEHALALYTHKPIFPGHVLIIPKRHVERFEMLSEVEFANISVVIKKVDLAVKKVFGTNSYLLLQKNGEEVGQTVPHVHFHYIPRQEGDSSTIKFMLKMFLENLKKPMSAEEMEKIVTEMKSAIKINSIDENN